jgi:type II secretory pathway component PulM
MKARWQAFKKRYWDGRAVQERRIIAMGTLILSPIIAYFLLWQPAHLANTKLLVTVPAMRTEAAHLRLQAVEAETVRHLPHPAVLDANALKSAIEESAVRHQLRSAISSLDAQPPNTVRVTLDSVSFEQWINWLRSLQQEQHIRVSSSGIASLPQKGFVKINATLINGGEE